MVVCDFYDEMICENLIELKIALQRRSKKNSNEFLLKKQEEYPFVTILIKDDWACVHFFENDCVHYAYMEDNEIKDDYIVFNMGDENMETIISKDLVISVEQANLVAEDFFCTNKRSLKLKWSEL